MSSTPKKCPRRKYPIYRIESWDDLWRVQILTPFEGWNTLGYFPAYCNAALFRKVHRQEYHEKRRKKCESKKLLTEKSLLEHCSRILQLPQEELLLDRMMVARVPQETPQ